jgi:energy-coupling factor transporter ATP-binding protein EcfA2
MYNVDLDQAVKMIATMGHKRTILVQGHIGTGKSSMLKTLEAMFPTHTGIYFDGTTKDLGDLALPYIAGVNSDSVSFRTVPHEELGLHESKPVIIMLDEYGKANPAVKQGLTAFMLERRMGNLRLHPDSIVFATTNLGGEGVGDLLVAHQRNRITVVTLKKPDHMSFIEWGINNGIDHTLLGWVKDNPHVFQSFEDVKNPDDNPYIFHPRSQRAAFVTPRSLEAASDWLKVRDSLDDMSLTAALIGTVGDRAAMDLMAFVRLANDLPTLKSIKDSPETAKVPTSAAAVCMVVYRTLASIEADWVSAWMTYMLRLPSEAQALFVNGVRAPKYHMQGVIMTHGAFTKFAREKSYLFSADV